MSLLNFSMLQKIAPVLESAVNKALTMDPGSQKHLKRLKGCVLELHISSAKRSFFFGVESEENSQNVKANSGSNKSHQQPSTFKVTLLTDAHNPSVQLKGSALAFVKLATYADKNSLFKTKELEMSGDSVRSQQIQSFMLSLNIDWDGLLANFVGDVPAHLLGSSVRSGFSWGKSLSLSLIRDIEEFIKYEVRLLPTRALAKKQFIAIDKLFQATEALEKRIKQRLSASKSKAEILP